MRILHNAMMGAVLLLVFSGNSCAKPDEGEVTICAAASLTNVLHSVGGDFSQRNSVKVNLHLAGTNTLRLQIEQGVPCDLFLSADHFNVERLIALQLVDPSESIEFMSNTLVVIAAVDAQLQLKRLEELSDLVPHVQLSLADPQSVPSGLYARESLNHVLLWEQIKDHIIPAVDIRAAMAQVEAGNIGLGIVYKTDAMISSRVKIIYEIPGSLHSPISYRLCLLKDREHRQAAEDFYHYLQSQPVKIIFRQHGFQI